MSQIKTKLIQIKNLLDGKIEGAPCFIASDRIHAWEICKNRTDVAKIAVGFAKENARSSFPGGDITGRVNQYYYAIISRGRSIGQNRSDSLIYGTASAKPLFELAEIMRDALRAIRFDPVSDEQPDYVGIEAWDMGAFNIDAYEVQIWVGTQLPLMAPLQANQIPR